MKIKLLFFLFFIGHFLSVQAQEERIKNNQIGINVFNSFLNFPNRLELSYQLKNNDENTKINPVIIAGLNTGKSFMTNPENDVSTEIIHQYSNKSQYIKAGIDLITKRKQNGCDNYFQFLVGYSNNTATNKLRVKGHYYDDFYYTDITNFNAVILQAWYFAEFKIYNQFIGSVGLGMSGAYILNNSNPEVPISDIGGSTLLLFLQNDIQYMISPTLKFSIHYKF